MPMFAPPDGTKGREGTKLLLAETLNAGTFVLIGKPPAPPVGLNSLTYVEKATLLMTLLVAWPCVKLGCC